MAQEGPWQIQMKRLAEARKLLAAGHIKAVPAKDLLGANQKDWEAWKQKVTTKATY